MKYCLLIPRQILANIVILYFCLEGWKVIKSLIHPLFSSTLDDECRKPILVNMGWMFRVYKPLYLSVRCYVFTCLAYCHSKSRHNFLSSLAPHFSCFLLGWFLLTFILLDEHGAIFVIKTRAHILDVTSLVFLSLVKVRISFFWHPFHCTNNIIC